MPSPDPTRRVPHHRPAGPGGVVVNHQRVQRLMARHGIAGRRSRPKVRNDGPGPTATPFPDLVERDFVREGLDELWVGDLERHERP